MAFLFFRLHGIKMLVYGLALKQDAFELQLAQLLNCWKIRKDEYQDFVFKNNLFNGIFQLKVQSSIFTKSLFSLEAETLALLNISSNTLKKVVNANEKK